MSKRTPGEPAGLDRAQVLATALRIVDREGLAALTMRCLAAELGVEAMTLYHHVSNKEDLLDGLVEQVTIQVHNDPKVHDWRQLLQTSAMRLRDSLSRHPNILPLVVSRPAVTSGNLDMVEGFVQRLSQEGFSLARSLTIIYSIVDATISNCARTAAESNRDDVSAQVDSQRHPLLAEAAASGEGDPLEVVLNALISGFDAERDEP